MIRLSSDDSLPDFSGGSVVTLGNFDGLHRGHEELVKRVVGAARSLGVPSVLLSFVPHPAEVLRPEVEFRKISTLNGLSRQLQKLGLDYLFLEKFTKELSELSGPKYLDQGILARFRPKKIMVGHDFAFGKDRSSGLDYLVKEGPGLGVEVEIIPALERRGGIVSSTRIRAALGDGDLELAGDLMGRPYSLRGKVEHGAGRGEKLGFPTANLDTGQVPIVPRGVYCSRLRCLEGCFDGISNLGVSPTFESRPQEAKLETYVLDRRLNLYGEEVQVELLSHIRPEKKFESAKALVEQIEHDIVIARKFFGEKNA